MKNLYRSENNKICAGILGGLGEYYTVDPVLFRAAFIFITFITGLAPGLVAYVICIFIIPKKSDMAVRQTETNFTKTEE